MNPDVDLAAYDCIVVNSSGGKDSQTLLDVVCTEADRKKVLDRVIVAHADLGRIEWPGASTLAEEQAAHYGVLFWKMARPKGDLLDYAIQRGKWPSPKQRWCTSDLKRDQINKLFTQISKTLDGNIRVLNCLGMRAEESPGRAKLVPFAHNTRASTGTRSVDNFLGIHSWGVDAVWANIRSSGIPHHYAYDLGMPRLSCVFCIYAPRQALVLAGQRNPELLEAYVRAEKDMGFSFKADLSLSEIQDEIRALGTTTVVVPDWKM